MNRHVQHGIGLLAERRLAIEHDRGDRRVEWGRRLVPLPRNGLALLIAHGFIRRSQSADHELEKPGVQLEFRTSPNCGRIFLNCSPRA
jgi:hypothetical protein